jgi:hypothetical protein
VPVRAERVVAGLPRTDKVLCQVCGRVKEAGERCEECGFPLIYIEPTASGSHRIFLPLCPSTNDRMEVKRMGRFSRLGLTDEARDYIASVGRELGRIAREVGICPLRTWELVDLWLVLPRASCDCHNYGKVLFDALERAGVVENDKYIMPLYRGVGHSTQETQCVIQL